MFAGGVTWAEYECFFECFHLTGRERLMGLRPVFVGPRYAFGEHGAPVQGLGLGVNADFSPRKIPSRG